MYKERIKALCDFGWLHYKGVDTIVQLLKYDNALRLLYQEVVVLRK